MIRDIVKKTYLQSRRCYTRSDNTFYSFTPFNKCSYRIGQDVLSSEIQSDLQYNELFNLKRAGKICIAMKCLLSYHPLLINTSLILANHAKKKKKTGMKMFWLCKMLKALLSLHNNRQLTSYPLHPFIFFTLSYTHIQMKSVTSTS